MPGEHRTVKQQPHDDVDALICLQKKPTKFSREIAQRAPLFFFFLWMVVPAGPHRRWAYNVLSCCALYYSSVCS